ncbi:MAG: hypothetical protein MK028_02080 [Dehalococcoidia bacterium]|nr:hypothetical protein [Dehalococcoidia bacterium]
MKTTVGFLNGPSDPVTGAPSGIKPGHASTVIFILRRLPIELGSSSDYV